jgi:hypothetical protein
MEMSQYATHRLDHLRLRAAAYRPGQGQHERVHDRDGQPCEIAIGKMLAEMMKKPFPPTAVKIERRFA